MLELYTTGRVITKTCICGEKRLLHMTLKNQRQNEMGLEKQTRAGLTNVQASPKTIF